ncbi:MAG: SPASM domain-containing protein, partial [Promethearchaeota archaeon]
RRTRCGIGTSITITSTGQLRPCVFSEPTGHILNDKLIDWHHQMLEKYSSLSVDNFQQCKNCDLRYICSGGCALLFEHRKRCSINEEESSKIKRYFYERLIHETFL